MGTEGIIDRYVNFYTDFAFKKLFGTEMNKDLLISFLNALLQGREVVLDVNYLNTEHLGTQEYDRRAVFDVYCKNDKGEVFLVEMQKGEQQFFKDRSIYYSTFAIREQAPRGEWNYELKGVYTIGILNFCFDKEREGNYYHEVKLMDTATKEVFYDKLVFIYLEMPKFTKQENELESLFDKWLYVIRNLAALMERPRVLQEKVFAHLFEAAEIAKFSKGERYEYEESLKAYRDWFSVMATAELRGEERGKEKGLKEGLEKGRIEERLRNARGLKARGVDADIIAQVTGLSEDDILGL
ncbi:MAG: PD-(D/E)XK nuclease family transposase [Paraprevotella sp.]|uniref:Rpn family recombination-promoting nuclease/putative transposase n=1 Tax=Paraprevotella sp. TaxID=2049036 RepID=UPI00257EC056|nr:Rpn family recombination-promoting nuclease/putative transposase [Paraprevotella sp.]MBS4806530.1 PD-(D/E)XK nuclease family transposase [Paraprevotella sp.]